MSDDLDALRAKAEAATPGPWRQSPMTPSRVSTRDGSIGVAWHSAGGEMDRKAERTAAFIAAASPATVLALLDRLAAAELDVARADSLAHGYTDEIAQTHTRATAAEARAERLAVVVEKARAQFAFYAEQHRAKRTEDGDRKARVNDEMVAMCVAALAAEPAGEREGGA